MLSEHGHQGENIERSLWILVEIHRYKFVTFTLETTILL